MLLSMIVKFAQALRLSDRNGTNIVSETKSMPGVAIAIQNK